MKRVDDVVVVPPMSGGKWEWDFLTSRSFFVNDSLIVVLSASTSLDSRGTCQLALDTNGIVRVVHTRENFTMRTVRIRTRDVFKQGVGSGWYPTTQGEVYVVVAERTNTDPSQTAVIFGMPQLMVMSPDGDAFWTLEPDFVDIECDS